MAVSLYQRKLRRISDVHLDDTAGEQDGREAALVLLRDARHLVAQIRCALTDRRMTISEASDILTVAERVYGTADANSVAWAESLELNIAVESGLTRLSGELAAISAPPKEQSDAA